MGMDILCVMIDLGKERQAMTWKIQAISGDLTGQEISIDRDMLVGRHQQADIVLQQSEISRKHAAFFN